MKVRLSGALGLAALAMVCLSGQARAQGGRGMGMMMGGGGNPAFRVLTTPEGATELKLTDDQKSKLEVLAQTNRDNMRERMTALRDELQGASPEEGREKMQATMKELADATNKEVKAILDEGQYTRYQQINLQAMGVDAFSQKETQEKLNLTAEQKTKVTEITTALREKAGGLRDEFGDDFRGMVQKSQELRTEAQGKVTALLTDDQKATWKELTGAAFQMPAFQFRRPGGGN